MMRSVTAGHALRKLLSHQRYEAHRRLSAVFETWEEIVGLTEGRMARPLSLEDGVLTVGAATPTVASEVSLMGQRYLERINAYFGMDAVQELRVRVLQARAPELSQRESEHRLATDLGEFDPDSVSLDEGELRWVDDTAGQVDTLKVRASLKRVLLLHLKRRKWDSQGADES